ncbi:hypothetical protein CEXT_73301 [Caerostris extrusa]|uniref:Uncharacterized protein n=1 Tax=Caerostris extrusa TaxID=172846 RepID=A0AAV4XIY7_CAEEX|nr:hypothetical protein CEXT_73301 [Caerostris extrusa]
MTPIFLPFKSMLLSLYELNLGLEFGFAKPPFLNVLIHLWGSGRGWMNNSRSGTEPFGTKRTLRKYYPSPRLEFPKEDETSLFSS